MNEPPDSRRDVSGSTFGNHAFVNLGVIQFHQSATEAAAGDQVPSAASFSRTVFRLTKVPSHLDRQGAAELLASEQEIQPGDIRIYSLAHSLGVWRGAKTATLMFTCVPPSLDDTQTISGQLAINRSVRREKDGWSIRVLAMQEALRLDTHFNGFTPLYDPPPGEHEADRIAISGLASHPFGSWQPKGDDKSFMWLRDALPRSLPGLYWAYETRTSPTLTIAKDGKATRSGPEVVLVSPLSATRGRYESDPSSDTIFPINENHSDMVKFGDASQTLPIVVEKLKSILRTTSQESPAKDETFSKTGNAVQSTNANHHFAQENLQLRGGKAKTTLHDNIVQSLKSSERDGRLAQIEEKFQNTFEWIFDLPELGFVEWLRNETGLFWINGKPGSGKSTLMKYIVQSSTTHEHLHNWKANTIDVKIAFFFHHRGTAMQKSFEGLLKSILSQVLESVPGLLPTVLAVFDQDHTAKFTAQDWNMRRLEAGLRAILEQKKRPVRLIIFFDALDEYDGQPDFIADFLKSLVDVPSGSSTRVKVCFSSRPWGQFSDAFNSQPSFTLEDHTTDDITQYCVGGLKDTHSDESLSDLVPEIVRRSRGVFLWVMLVVRDLADPQRRNLSVEALSVFLSRLPADLNDYYRDIISRIGQRYRWRAYATLEILLRARAALSPSELVMAVEGSNCGTYPEIINAYRSSRDNKLKPEERLRHYCGGLVNVVDSKHDSTIIDDLETAKDKGKQVQLMHQTVREFVNRPTFKQIVLGDSARMTVENGDSFLTKYCVATLERRVSGKSSLDVPSTNVSLEAILIYAESAERTTGRSLKRFLDSIPRACFPLLLDSGNYLTTRVGEYYINSPLALVVVLCLQIYFADCLALDRNVLRDSREPYLDIIYHHWRYMRNMGLATADDTYINMYRMLMHNGYDSTFSFQGVQYIFEELWAFPVTDRDDDSYSRILLARAQLLLRASYDINTTIRVVAGVRKASRRRSSATTEDWVEVCTSLLHLSPASVLRLLLDHLKMDVSALDSEGRTLLDFMVFEALVVRRRASTLPELRLTGQLGEERILLGLYDRAWVLLEHGGMLNLYGEVEWRDTLERFRDEAGLDIGPLQERVVWRRKHASRSRVVLRSMFGTRAHYMTRGGCGADLPVSHKLSIPSLIDPRSKRDTRSSPELGHTSPAERSECQEFAALMS